DDLYRATIDDVNIKQAVKEVRYYGEALKAGFDTVKKSGLLLTRDIVRIQSILEKNDAGIRKQSGTHLKNDSTGDVVFMPPQNEKDIRDALANLETFINDNSLDNLDPLIKMAVIHHQFESIHPFYDGNGRTGRIINILYLVGQGLLDIPILYFSRFIIQNKTAYYRLLQDTRTTEDWEPWLLYMLDGIDQTAKQTIITTMQIKELMMDYKHRFRTELPKIYSQDFLNLLFRHPYTKIENVTNELQVGRLTASKYLNLLTKHGFMEKHKIGKYNYYVNKPLFELFLGC
ncbi:MAG: Fic family protein, partial [Ghiorsea sp.]|nr:Fic family protein [Ghiorsea sp.]